MKAVLSLKLGGCYFLDFFLVGSGLSYFWVILFSHPVMPTTAWVGTGFFVDWEDPPLGRRGGRVGWFWDRTPPGQGFGAKCVQFWGMPLKVQILVRLLWGVVRPPGWVSGGPPGGPLKEALRERGRFEVYCRHRG